MLEWETAGLKEEVAAHPIVAMKILKSIEESHSPGDGK